MSDKFFNADGRAKDHGWDELLKLLDDKEIYVTDLMAVVSTKFLETNLKSDSTNIMLQGQKLKITIERA